ncbi:LysR substrate-binding domain-containing protein [Sphingobium sp. AN558]|uniref:LysR substrate-binding domain-containing protein n=1 Tax=Sphingobium sp. AN558 TaxID=3133442 RepID=UPI0030C25C8B
MVPEVNIILELETGWSPVLLGRLEAGETDLSFMMGDIDPARFDSIMLRRYGLALIVHREHVWADSPYILPEAMMR